MLDAFLLAISIMGFIVGIIIAAILSLFFVFLAIDLFIKTLEKLSV